MIKRRSHTESGFTLLEVLVGITVLAVGAAVALAVISGSLGNIRKVQQRTKIIEQAQAVLEEALLDDTIVDATSLGGTLDDGTSWTVTIEDYDVPAVQSSLVNNDVLQPSQGTQSTANLPVKMLQYTVELHSTDLKYTLQTLKLVNTSTTSQ
jgi:prepilin-type N-terminal cleavage/methylation domain-containing protein